MPVLKHTYLRVPSLRVPDCPSFYPGCYPGGRPGGAQTPEPRSPDPQTTFPSAQTPSSLSVPFARSGELNSPEKGDPGDAVHPGKRCPRCFGYFRMHTPGFLQTLVRDGCAAAVRDGSSAAARDGSPAAARDGSSAADRDGSSAGFFRARRPGQEARFPHGGTAEKQARF